MARFLKKRNITEAQPPGSITFVGSQKMEKPKIRIFNFNKEQFEETELSDTREIEQLENTSRLHWINVDGLHDIELIRHLGEVYKLHPLILDGIVNTGNRPKIEAFDEDLFIILKMLKFDTDKEVVRSKQVSFMLGEGHLLTFQEESDEKFDPIRDRLRKSGSNLRTKNLDYLLYRLLDAIVSNYIVVIEQVGQKVEEVEESLLSNPSKSILEDINSYKKEINYMAKIIRPTREAILNLSRSESSHIDHKKTKVFLKDLLDLVSHTLEICETYRTMLNDQLNIYHTNVSSRLNDILKVLTVFSVVFVPLTFIAGVYGTNFDVLPELHYQYSYFIMLGVMIVLAAGMLVYFKRKKWF